MLSANSYSEWTLFDIDLTTESAVYIEKNTIKKDNNYVYYWELMDFWEPISFTEDMMSVKVQRQVNCNNMKHQNGNTECGVYCLHFLTEMLKGKNFKEYIRNDLNDKVIEQFRNIFFIK